MKDDIFIVSSLEIKALINYQIKILEAKNSPPKDLPERNENICVYINPCTNIVTALFISL